MTTGAYWDVRNPLEPWGWLDPDDVLTIPCDFADWLTDQGTTYVSHELTAADELEADDVSVVAGVIRYQVSKAVGATLVTNTKYGVTCQITAADGQKRSQTLYFRAREL